MPVLQEKLARAPGAVIKDLFGEHTQRSVFSLVACRLSLFFAERAGRGGADDGWGIPQFFESKLKGKEQLAIVSPHMRLCIYMLYLASVCLFLGAVA